MTDKAILCYIHSWSHESHHVYSLVGTLVPVGSDFWLINGGYLRMRDIQVGYDFKRILLKKTSWITRLNVALSGQNIFTISEATKYGIDPENGSANRYDYPNERVFAINFGIGF